MFFKISREFVSTYIKDVEINQKIAPKINTLVCDHERKSVFKVVLSHLSNQCIYNRYKQKYFFNFFKYT